MPVDRLKKFLEDNDVRFVTIKHSPAFTAQEIAALAHVPGKELAKTVMVKLDGAMAMVVLPAPDPTPAALRGSFALAFPKRLATAGKALRARSGALAQAAPPGMGRGQCRTRS